MQETITKSSKINKPSNERFSATINSFTVTPKDSIFGFTVPTIIKARKRALISTMSIDKRFNVFLE